MRKVLSLFFLLILFSCSLSAEEEAVKILEGYTGGVTSIQAGLYDIYSGGGMSIIVWDRFSFKKKLTITSPSVVNSISFDRTFIYSGHEDGIIRVWNKTDGAAFANMSEHTGSVNHVKVDGGFLYSASADGTARVWDKARRTPIALLAGHAGEVYSVKNDSARIYTTSGLSGANGYGQVKIWDKTTYQIIETREIHSNYVTDIEIRDDFIYTSSADRKIIKWNRIDWTKMCEFTGHLNKVNDIDVDGAFLYSVSDDKKVKIWNTADCSLLKTLSSHQFATTSVAYDRWKMFSGSYDSNVIVWNKDYITKCFDNDNICRDVCNFTVDNDCGCEGSYLKCGTACIIPHCTLDSDCDDSNSLTTDSCQNNGTCTSFCRHEQNVLNYSTPLRSFRTTGNNITSLSSLGNFVVAGSQNGSFFVWSRDNLIKTVHIGSLPITASSSNSNYILASSGSQLKVFLRNGYSLVWETETSSEITSK